MAEKTIGDKINELLKIRDIKQADLHRLSDLSTGLISDLCNNRRTSVSIETLRKIATALRIHPAYFLEERTIGPADILPHLTEEQIAFIQKKGALPWIDLNKYAEEKGLTPERIRQAIDAFMSK